MMDLSRVARKYVIGASDQVRQDIGSRDIVLSIKRDKGCAVSARIIYVFFCFRIYAKSRITHNAAHVVLRGVS